MTWMHHHPFFDTDIRQKSMSLAFMFYVSLAHLQAFTHIPVCELTVFLSYSIWQPLSGSLGITYCSQSALPLDVHLENDWHSNNIRAPAQHTRRYTEVMPNKQMYSLCQFHLQIFCLSNGKEECSPLVSTHLFVGCCRLIISLEEIVCGLMQKIYWNRLDW